MPEREKAIIKRLLSANRGELPQRDVVSIFREIFNSSRSAQEKPKIAFLGPETTFSHLAALKIFGKASGFFPVKTIGDVFAEVEKDRVNYGVVPVENSTEGVVSYTLDMFLESDLKIYSEYLFEVFHYLLSRSKGYAKIKKLYSHPQVIAQCRGWIEENIPEAHIIEVESTSRAAERAAGEAGSAAIASVLAAEKYGLQVVASRIEDSTSNMTRFLVIGKSFASSSGEDKTSILISLKDRVGALHGMLEPFYRHRINLTKIESRPSRKKVWDYVFFIDFDGHIEDRRVKKALSELEDKCVMLKVLGSYPKSEQA